MKKQTLVRAKKQLKDLKLKVIIPAKFVPLFKAQQALSAWSQNWFASMAVLKYMASPEASDHVDEKINELLAEI